MEYLYVDHLEVGDSIYVAGGNYLMLGIFIGKGRGTIQYYTIGGILYAKESEKKHNKPYKIYKTYVSETSKWRIAKVKNPIFNTIEQKEEYEEAVEFLIEKGIIKHKN
jgi:hypothetical protein